MAEPYDNRFDGYLGWNDDEEYTQFQRDYDEWVSEHLEDSLGLLAGSEDHREPRT